MLVRDVGDRIYHLPRARDFRASHTFNVINKISRQEIMTMIGNVQPKNLGFKIHVTRNVQISSWLYFLISVDSTDVLTVLR